MLLVMLVSGLLLAYQAFWQWVARETVLQLLVLVCISLMHAVAQQLVLQAQGLPTPYNLGVGQCRTQ